MSQYLLKEKKEGSVKLLKIKISTKINELTELNLRLKKKLFDLRAIFEPFYTNRDKGSGLVFWVSYDMVERYN